MATKTTTAHGKRAASRPRPRAASGKSSSLVYVYCIVQSADAPPLQRLDGLPDAGPARASSLGESRWLVLADVPRSRFDEGALAAGLQDLDWVGTCAVAHDALIMEVMKSGPVLPMRLFTMFESEERACAQARAAADQIARTLCRVANHAEYGVRIGATPAARRARASSTGSGQASASGQHRPARGRSFLEQKRDQIAARRRPPTLPPAERRRVFERLSALADDARERAIPDSGSSVWLDGAFLVSLDSAPAFRREVQQLTDELQREGHDVVLTGPWPPYSFLDEHGVED